MARRLRIQYEGAIYHVMNRGNYRTDVFESAGAAQAFEAVLEETCRRFEWRLHAYVVMRNHFHAAVTTAKANLSEGMHWLQGTYAVRFNRFRDQQGHLFQGRYYAGLIQDGAALRQVVDYIHLNPVRAKLVTPEQVAQFRWSSLRRFMAGDRWSCLFCAEWLKNTGLEDTREGTRSYARHLQHLAVKPDEQARLGLEEVRAAWAVGTPGWKRDVARDNACRSLDPSLIGPEIRAMREARWQELLNGAMTQAGYTGTRAESDKTSASWKIAMAAQLRTHGVPYRWIAHALKMKSAAAVRTHVWAFRRIDVLTP